MLIPGSLPPINIPTPVRPPIELLDKQFPKDLQRELLTFCSLRDRAAVNMAASPLCNPSTYHNIMRMGRLHLQKTPSLDTYQNLWQEGWMEQGTSAEKRTKKLESVKARMELLATTEVQGCSERTLLALIKQLLEARSLASEASEEIYAEIAHVNENQCNIMVATALGTFAKELPAEKQNLFPQEQLLLKDLFLQLNTKSLCTITMVLLIGDVIRAKHKQDPNCPVQESLDELFSREIRESALFRSALDTLPPDLRYIENKMIHGELKGYLLRTLPIMFTTLGDDEEQKFLLEGFLDWTAQEEERSLGLAYLTKALTTYESELTEELLPRCLLLIDQGAALPEELHTLEVYKHLLLAQHDFASYSCPLPWLKGKQLTREHLLELTLLCARTDHPRALQALLQQQDISGERLLQYEDLEESLRVAAHGGREEVVYALLDVLDPESLLLPAFRKNFLANYGPGELSDTLFKKCFRTLLLDLDATKDLLNQLLLNNPPQEAREQATRLLGCIATAKRQATAKNFAVINLLHDIQRDIFFDSFYEQLNPHLLNSPLALKALRNLFNSILPSRSLPISNLAVACFALEQTRYSSLLQESPVLRADIERLAKESSLPSLLETLRELSNISTIYGDLVPLFLLKANKATNTTESIDSQPLSKVQRAWNWICDLRIVRTAKKLTRIWLLYATYLPRLSWHRIVHAKSWKERVVAVVISTGIALVVAQATLPQVISLLIGNSLWSYKRLRDVQNKAVQIDEIAEVACICSN